MVIVYLDEHEDARDTQQRVEKTGRRCLCLSGDVGDPVFCKQVIEKTVATFGKIDILINNAAEQHDYDSILDITPDQLKRTFNTNIFSMFYMIQSAYSYLKNGGVIVNSTSVTAYQGHPRGNHGSYPITRHQPCQRQYTSQWCGSRAGMDAFDSRE